MNLNCRQELLRGDSLEVKLSDYPMPTINRFVEEQHMSYEYLYYWSHCLQCDSFWFSNFSSQAKLYWGLVRCLEVELHVQCPSTSKSNVEKWLDNRPHLTHLQNSNSTLSTIISPYISHSISSHSSFYPPFLPTSLSQIPEHVNRSI